MSAHVEHLAFGPYQADVSLSRLTRNGTEIELRPQAFQVLKALAENRGGYLDYEQMIREAWGGNVVSKHTVAVTVGEVKRALREYGSWITYRPRLGYRLDIPRSEELIKRGRHFASRHTGEGFDKAICCFLRAAEEDPSDFRAYEGLSSALLMLATWGMRSPNEAYCKFLDSHSHAVALRGITPELRADRAHGLHVFERKFAEAEYELLQARNEEPNLAAIQVRLAMLYISRGRFEEAGAALAPLASADPLNPVFGFTLVILHLCQRDFERAVSCGRQSLELHPYHQLSRFFYADALECAGRFEEALAEYSRASVVAPDLLWLRAMEGCCLAKLGRGEEASAVLDELKDTRRTSYVDPYHLALLMDAVGRRDEAFAELGRACDENSSMLHMLDVEPKLDNLRQDPRFLCIRERAFRETSRTGALAS
jgi:tetratricopeptide (TPR) repeat protein